MRVKVNVRFDSSIYGYAEPGDIMDVPPKVAKDMMAVGMVTPVKETKPQPEAPTRVKETTDVDAAISSLTGGSTGRTRRGRR